MTPDFYYGEMLRWSFGFENPNKAAVIFACWIPLTWAGWLGGFRLHSAGWKIVCLLVAAVGFLAAWGCLLLTFSRGGLVAALAGMAVVSAWAWWHGKNEQNAGRAGYFRSISFWLSCLLLGLVVAAAWNLGMGSRSVEAIGDDASVGNRIELWGAALQMASENPTGFGPGRSGAEFMQWYQDVDRTEGYRTMVNSYLTFLVEYGWWAFALVVLVSAAFWAWTWPGSNTPNASWSVALWASLVGFFVSGIFSTTMEEPLVWILPALATIALIGLRIAKGRFHRVPKTQLAFALGTACLLLSILFIAGVSKSAADPMQRTFARTSEETATVVGISPKNIEATARQLVVVPDESVLGPDWGKLLRTLSAETGRTVRIGHDGENDSGVSDILLVGDAINRNQDPTRARRTFLLVPARSDGPIPDDVVLFLSEIDEDGRGDYWREKIASESPESAKIISLSGVGTRVEWAWEQVVAAITAP